ncbi:RNA-binding protein [Escherichia coli]|nr:RNA-binding protein [Escherichia coli]
MTNKHLHLNLKGEYFHAIRAGKKVEEYRLYNNYWRKRLEGREYTRLIIKWGYPANDEKERILILPYMGYTIKTIQHPLFGDDPVKVFAIKCDIYWQYRF